MFPGSRLSTTERVRRRDREGTFSYRSRVTLTLPPGRNLHAPSLEHPSCANAKKYLECLPAKMARDPLSTPLRPLPPICAPSAPDHTTLLSLFIVSHPLVSPVICELVVIPPNLGSPTRPDSARLVSTHKERASRRGYFCSRFESVSCRLVSVILVKLLQNCLYLPPFESLSE